MDPLAWGAADESEKINSDGLLLSLYDVIPLNPRSHPVKLLVVIPVYVTTSLPIFNKPYSFGNPFVVSTEIVVAPAVVIPVDFVAPLITSGVKLSNFKYWSRLSTKSIGPPVYSWEI